jgi:protease I
MPKARKVLVISADRFEDTELLAPMYRLQEAGYQVDLAAPEKGEIKGKHEYTIEANLSVKDIEAGDLDGYDMLVLPGGKAPAELREIPEVLDIAKRFAESAKPIAAICHGPQILISAGLMRGVKATSYKSVASELKEAGADFVDEEVVVDGQYVTSRHPPDIPAFNREIMAKLAG